MGLFPQCTIHRFIDNLTVERLETEASILLCAFFEATGARTAQRLARPYSIGEAIDSFPVWLFRPQEMPQEERVDGLNRDLFAKAAKDERHSKLAREVFAQQAQGYTSLVIGAGTVSAGMSFGIDKQANPRSRWHLDLYRGPLPVLRLLTYHGDGFTPPRGWERDLFASDTAAHVLWMDARAGVGFKSYWGRGDHIYLLKKRYSVFPFSKGDSSKVAIEAGLRLRELCRGVWNQQRVAKADLYKLSSLRQKRFMQGFDEALLYAVGAEKLTELLKTMGTNRDHWLHGVPNLTYS